MTSKKISEFIETNSDSFLPFENSTTNLNYKVARLDINPAIKFNTDGVLLPAVANGQNAVAIGFSAVANGINCFQLGQGTNTLNNSLQFLSNTFINQFTIQAKITTSIPSYTAVAGAVNINNTTNELFINNGILWNKLIPNPYINIKPSSLHNLLPTGSINPCVAISASTVSAEVNSSAFGAASEALGEASLAIGYKAKALEDYSIAIGSPQITTLIETRAEASAAISIGNYVKSTGTNAISLGNNLTGATGVNSIRIGSVAATPGLNSIAIGSDNVGAATGIPTDNICIGRLIRSNQHNSVSINGTQSPFNGISSTIGAVSLGYGARSQASSVALGYVTGSGSSSLTAVPGNVAIGSQSTASGLTNSVTIGNLANNSNSDFIRISNLSVSAATSSTWSPTGKAIVSTQTNAATPTLVNPSEGTISQFTGTNGFLYVRIGGVWKQTAAFTP